MGKATKGSRTEDLGTEGGLISRKPGWSRFAFGDLCRRVVSLRAYSEVRILALGGGG